MNESKNVMPGLGEDFLREKILRATLKQYQQSGIYFTIDELCKELMISKKTLYLHYAGKEQLLQALIEDIAQRLHAMHEEIRKNDTLSTVEKVVELLTVAPAEYQGVCPAQRIESMTRFPKLYQTMTAFLDQTWETVFAVMKEAAEEGQIRPVNITMLKAILQAVQEYFLSKDVLQSNNMTYEEGMREVLHILGSGIFSKNDETNQ